MELAFINKPINDTDNINERTSSMHVQVAHQRWRSYYCLSLPEGFSPPIEQACVDELTQRVKEALGLPQITPQVVSHAPRVWLLTWFHGTKKQYCAATYEEGAFGQVHFYPRLNDAAIVDLNHRVLYVTKTPEAPNWVSAMNGTLFPNRAADAPFHTFSFDLTRFQFLTMRHPLASRNDLILKQMTWVEAGRLGSERTCKFVTNGFDEVEAGAFEWPRHISSLSLSCHPSGTKKEFCLGFPKTDGVIQCSLTPERLTTVANIIKICTHPDVQGPRFQ